jgi:hypothetical protein
MKDIPLAISIVALLVAIYSLCRAISWYKKTNKEWKKAMAGWELLEKHKSLREDKQKPQNP